MEDNDFLTELTRSGGYVLIAAIGGILGHMMRKVGANKPIRIGETVLQGVGAAFAGYLILLGCRYMGINSELSGIVTGLCGWLGADASIVILQSYIYKKLNISEGKMHD